MSQLLTTKMSSRGQVLIPEEIRKQLNLSAGTQFSVVAYDDVLILKVITSPKLSDLKGILNKARAAAKAVGLTPEDVEQAIKEIRRK